VCACVNNRIRQGTVREFEATGKPGIRVREKENNQRVMQVGGRPVSVNSDCLLLFDSC